MNIFDIWCKCLRLQELEGVESCEVDGRENELAMVGPTHLSRGEVVTIVIEAKYLNTN